MKAKALVLTVVSILIAGVIAATVWRELRPQTITFSDGSKLTLLAVDYGKRHKPPTAKSTTGATIRGHSFNTTNDMLVVWVFEQYASKQWHNFQYFVYDTAGAACVGSGGTSYNGRQGHEIVAVRLNAFPRRQGKFYLRVQEQGNDGQEMSDEKFVISNPVRGSFSELSPTPLPDSEDAGDLTVTLKKLVADAKMPFTRDSDDPDDPVNKGAQAVFHVERNGTNVSNWRPIAIETSDATSNHVVAISIQTQAQSDDLATTFQYALWPDEPAWKLRVEFSKQSGFTSDELWTVQNIPLQTGRQQDFWNYGNRRGNTNSAFAEGDLNGIHLKIFPVKQFTDMPANSQPQGGLTIETQPPLPKGVRMTIVQLTDDQTNDIGFWDYGSGGNGKSTAYRYGLRELDGVTNVNLTLALHKSRFVEFTAKPEMETAPASDENAN